MRSGFWLVFGFALRIRSRIRARVARQVLVQMLQRDLESSPVQHGTVVRAQVRVRVRKL